ncbi:cell adhesion molecule Dscam2 isoform X2 [Lepeophtheirus salmonis]|uniref:cell adhesion molecule Dscam2 isoform X2 n=1 Tax=Lepeophtheirus salmonis TaxID=72036 RepID=UPI001AE47190|nr:Down syndrome cell adhesion molecule-like protein Dscam2 isoform X2 [Lepeophtheirus salmonis]
MRGEKTQGPGLLLSITFLTQLQSCVQMSSGSPPSYSHNVVESIIKLGPSLHNEPPPIVYFSNDTGTVLDCSAHGTPPPSVKWIYADGGLPLGGEGNGLREILAHNQSLKFYPFSALRFNPDIHSTDYRCIASSESGVLASGVVRIRAVLSEKLDIRVLSLPVAPENPALLSCQVHRGDSSPLLEFLSVEKWEKDGTTLLKNNEDGKHLYLSSGDLAVLNVELTDSVSQYRCIVRNTLTGRLLVSLPSSIQVISSAMRSKPNILHSKLGASAPSEREVLYMEEGQGAILPCFSSGSPPPFTSWFKENHHLLDPLPSSPQYHLFGPRGSALKIYRLQSSDSGIYRCVARNDVGESSFSIHLKVYSQGESSPPDLRVLPDIQSADIGSNARFSCQIPDSRISQIEVGLRWLVNGVSPRDPRILVRGDEIEIRNVQQEDGGIYQCFLSLKGNEYQASGELRLGDSLPRLQYAFIEQTLQPGPMVSLKCSATGSPTPIIKWKLDGFDLPNLERYLIGQYVTVHGDVISHLNISRSLVIDGGLYSCSVINRAGSIIHQGRLNIYGAPMIRPWPEEIKAIEGRTFVLHCPLGGFPIEAVLWEKDNLLLASNLRRKVLNNGTLILSDVAKERDEGSYKCTGSNRQGLSAMGKTKISVIVSPKIVPFAAPASLQQGERISLTCTIARGDAPLTLSWVKNNRPLNNNVGQKIISFDSYNSMLTIEALSLHHIGTYTCLARNKAGSAEYSQHITVHVPPAWKTKPWSTSSVQGESSKLYCQAEGSPAPKISWKKEIASQPGEFLEIIPPINSGIWIQSNKEKEVGGIDSLPTSDYGITNSTLIIERTSKSHAGRYLCLVSNGIGQDLHQFFNFTVKVPPRVTFPDRSFALNSALGDKMARLNCEAEGDKPITVTWMRQNEDIDVNSIVRYSLETIATERGVKTILSIHGINEEDESDYSCLFTNAFGRSSALIKLNVQEPPSPPKVIHIVEISSRFVRLSWTSNRRSGLDLPVSKYVIEWVDHKVPWELAKIKTINGRKEIEEERMTKSEEQVRLDGLRPNIYYKVRVFAENSLGRGRSSSELRLRTRGDKPDGKPVRIQIVDGPSPSTLIVSWEDPDENTWNGRITSYRLGWKLESDHSAGLPPNNRLQEGPKSSGGDNYNWTTVERYDRSDLRTILRELIPNSKYEILIQAQNRYGFGPVSKESGSTGEDLPLTPPRNIICTPMTSTSLQLTWAPPEVSDIRGRLLGYRLYYQDVNHKFSIPGTKESMTPSVILNSLNKFSNYSVMMAVFNSAGEGPFSSPFFCSTKEDVPGQPAKVKTFPLSDRSILVSWLPPQEPNGIIVSYTLYTRIRTGTPSTHGEPKGGTPIRRTARHFVVNGLKQSFYYQFWITASTKYGEGVRSEIKGERVIANGRSRPFIHSIGSEIVGEVGETISLPCHHMGPPRSVRRQWISNGIKLRKSSKMSFEDECLDIHEIEHSDEGNYSCIIERPLSHDQIVYSLRVKRVPNPPLIELNSASSNSLSLSWTSNQDKIDSPILGAIIHHKRKYGAPYETIIPPFYNFTLSHLNCGTEYTLYSTLFNAIGSSDQSNTLTVSTTGTKPSSSKNGAFIFPSNDSVRLDLYSWDVENEGCPVRYFVVDYRQSSALSLQDSKSNHHQNSPSWSLISNNLQTTSRRFTVRQLQPNTHYELRVVANNEAGSTSAYYKFKTLSNVEAAAKIAAEDDERGINSSKEASSSSSEGRRESWMSSKLIAIPIFAAAILIVSTSIGIALCIKKRRHVNKGFYLRPEDNTRSHLEDTLAKETMKNFQMMKEEQLYATIGAPSSTGSIQPLPPPPSSIDGADKSLMSSRGKDEINPYATFVLPGVAPGEETLRHIVYHENQTLPMSDAYSKSSESNIYTTLNHPPQQNKRSTHRSRRKPTKSSGSIFTAPKKKKKKKPLRELDSDSPVGISSSPTPSSSSSNEVQFIGSSSRTESADQMDFIQEVSSIEVIPRPIKQGIPVTFGHEAETTTDDEIFVKRGNQFVSLKSSHLKGRLPKDLLKLVSETNGGEKAVPSRFEDSSDCDISSNNPYSYVDV